MVFNADRKLEPPVGAEDRRSYQIELNHLVAADIGEAPGTRVEKTLARMMNNAAPGFDSEGRPVLRIRDGDEAVTVGVAQSNLSRLNPLEE